MKQIPNRIPMPRTPRLPLPEARIPALPLPR